MTKEEKREEARAKLKEALEALRQSVERMKKRPPIEGIKVKIFDEK